MSRDLEKVGQPAYRSGSPSYNQDLRYFEASFYAGVFYRTPIIYKLEICHIQNNNNKNRLYRISA